MLHWCLSFTNLKILKLLPASQLVAVNYYLCSTRAKVRDSLGWGGEGVMREIIMRIAPIKDSVVCDLSSFISKQEVVPLLLLNSFLSGT